jgi:hypothetical protein
MNVEETRQAIEVMQAFVDGKELEIMSPVGKWERVCMPRWAWSDTSYRIKPTPNLHPVLISNEDACA